MRVFLYTKMGGNMYHSITIGDKKTQGKIESLGKTVKKSLTQNAESMRN